MSEITPTGKNLTVVVGCEYLPLHSWLSLASWYSMSKNLPDAKVIVACSRKHFGRNGQLFRWAYRLRVPLHYYNPDDGIRRDCDLVLPVTTMAVRTYDPGCVGPAGVKTGTYATFVDCGDGCGSFIPSKWIDKVTGPFRNAVKRFGTQELTLNELKVLQLWESLNTLYTAI